MKEKERKEETLVHTDRQADKTSHHNCNAILNTGYIFVDKTICL
jgi:hypothetical protein